MEKWQRSLAVGTLTPLDFLVSDAKRFMFWGCIDPLRVLSVGSYLGVQHMWYWPNILCLILMYIEIIFSFFLLLTLCKLSLYAIDSACSFGIHIPCLIFLHICCSHLNIYWLWYLVSVLCDIRSKMWLCKRSKCLSFAWLVLMA